MLETEVSWNEHDLATTLQRNTKRHDETSVLSTKSLDSFQLPSAAACRCHGSFWGCTWHWRHNVKRGSSVLFCFLYFMEKDSWVWRHAVPTREMMDVVWWLSHTIRPIVVAERFKSWACARAQALWLFALFPGKAAIKHQAVMDEVLKSFVLLTPRWWTNESQVIGVTEDVIEVNYLLKMSLSSNLC